MCRYSIYFYIYMRLSRCWLAIVNEWSQYFFQVLILVPVQSVSYNYFAFLIVFIHILSVNMQAKHNLIRCDTERELSVDNSLRRSLVTSQYSRYIHLLLPRTPSANAHLTEEMARKHKDVDILILICMSTQGHIGKIIH